MANAACCAIWLAKACTACIRSALVRVLEDEVLEVEEVVDDESVDDAAVVAIEGSSLEVPSIPVVEEESLDRASGGAPPPW